MFKKVFTENRLNKKDYLFVWRSVHCCLPRGLESLLDSVDAHYVFIK